MGGHDEPHSVYSKVCGHVTAAWIKRYFRLVASVLLKISSFCLNLTRLACLAGMNAESRGTYDKYPLFSIELALCFVRMLVSTG